MTIFFFFFSVYILPLGNKPNKKRRFTSRDTTWYGEDSRNKQIGDYLDHFLFSSLRICLYKWFSSIQLVMNSILLFFSLSLSSALNSKLWFFTSDVCGGGGEGEKKEGEKKNGEIGDNRQTPTRK